MQQRQTRRDFEISENQPWSEDRFGRKQLAENLLRVIHSHTYPLTLAINGSWGTGKTKFVKMWQAHLRSEGYQTVYFNAWEHDFSQDPLMAFIYTLVKGKKENDGNLSQPGIRLLRGGYAAFKSIGVNASSKLTGGIINKDTIAQAKAAFNEAPKLEDQEVNRLFESIEKSMNDMDSLKDLFKDFVNAYTNADYKPMMIFIDELDRCKPSWAINLLEAIKHLFSESGNAVFVITTDREQLGKSIAGLYGPLFDGQTYLRRIFDFDFMLPDPDMTSYVKMLWEEVKLKSGNQPTQVLENEQASECIAFIADLLVNMSFSLRDTNQFFVKTHHLIAQLKSDQKQIGVICFDLYAIALQITDPEKFKQIFAIDSAQRVESASVWKNNKFPYKHTFWQSTNLENTAVMISAYQSLFQSNKAIQSIREQTIDIIRRAEISNEQISHELRLNIKTVIGLLDERSTHKQTERFQAWLNKINFASENLQLV